MSFDKTIVYQWIASELFRQAALHLKTWAAPYARRSWVKLKKRVRSYIQRGVKRR